MQLSGFINEIERKKYQLLKFIVITGWKCTRLEAVVRNTLPSHNRTLLDEYKEIQFSPERYKYLEWTEGRGDKGKKKKVQLKE